ncbi:CPBP family intramembrane glutamic endopeptidase [Dictyobacter formicarum]|uniref:CAAX prenyl protease 2/Lysostaphin resistance protein A-like domain-containing protein n=1 Tax=Dictyobacter formicarum TaxID=2778368 RepID=A0ABQ3VAX7_9CHLR|nr:CPBP family intramembrane glutamic endopeptidase [Dictyobacter formicarum]GHO82963.1 hypothetical protein KSZ_09690 [Dictyobacter formicarum]
MQDFTAASHEPQPGRFVVEEKNSALNRFFRQRPLLGTALLLLYFIVVLRVFSYIFQLGVKDWHLSFVIKNIIGECFYAVLIIIPLLLLGWWAQIGFTRGIQRKDIRLYIVPFIIIVLPSIVALPIATGKSSTQIIVLSLIASLLVGLTEESFFRGLLLQSALPTGIWPAVLISSVLFALVHLSNIVVGFTWNYVIGQALFAFGFGVLLSGLRLRTGSIWPGILFHAAKDFPGLILLTVNPRLVLSTPLNLALLSSGIYCVILLINAVIILRPRKARELRVDYGLQPVPLSPPVSNQLR